MLEWFSTETLAQILSAHPYWAIVGAFLTSFIESLAIIGAIMPGAIFMSVIGFLIAISVLDGGNIYIALAIGAILGNAASYWVGRFFCDRLRMLTFFQKKPHVLSNSENFFRKHGGKSIFIGQFLGPMRAVIPMTAGMLKMRPINFLTVAVPSAVVWSVVYTAPGFLLGALSVELPPEMMAKFAGASLFALAILWTITWILQFCCVSIWRWWHQTLKRIWDRRHGQQTQHHPQHLADNCVCSNARGCIQIHNQPLKQAHHQPLNQPYQQDYLQLVRISIVVLLMAILVGFSLFSQHPIYQQIELGLYHFTQSCRSALLEPVMVTFSAIGDDRPTAIAWTVTLLWMLWRRHFRLAWHWFLLFAATCVTLFGLKMLIISARPMGMVYSLSQNSYPSGHTILSVAVFGGFSAIAARIWPKIRNHLMLTAGAVIVLVAISRVYFGAHWLRDVVSGTLMGIILVLLTMISYYRRPAVVDGRALAIVYSATLLLTCPIYTAVNWHAFSSRYRQVWPVSITNSKALISHHVCVSGNRSNSNSDTDSAANHSERKPSVSNDRGLFSKINISYSLTNDHKHTSDLPYCIHSAITGYRYNRIGKIIEPFNLVLVGELADFSRALAALGWQNEPINSSVYNALQALFGTNLRNYRYLFSPLHRGQKMQLLATKATAQKDAVLVIQLWPAGIDLTDSTHPVWIGNISLHRQQSPFASKDGLLSIARKQRYLAATYQLSTPQDRVMLAQHQFATYSAPALSPETALPSWLDWDEQRLVILQHDREVNQPQDK